MIDWNKPLRTIYSQLPVTVVATLSDGSKVLTWEKCGIVMTRHVDAAGKNMAKTQYRPFTSTDWDHEVAFENVPEEPKNTIALWTPAREGWNGGYSIDKYEGKQVHSRSTWEGLLGKNPQGIVFVKVPV